VGKNTGVSTQKSLVCKLVPQKGLKWGKRIFTRVGPKKSVKGLKKSRPNLGKLKGKNPLENNSLEDSIPF